VHDRRGSKAVIVDRFDRYRGPEAALITGRLSERELHLMQPAFEHGETVAADAITATTATTAKTAKTAWGTVRQPTGS
jgi:hypothetical protein